MTRIFALIFFLMSAQMVANANSNLKPAVVDPRIELLSIVFRLADASEFKADYFKTYVTDIETHFGRHKNHPLIPFVQNMRKEQGIGYDAVAAMAVHLTYPGLEPIVPFDETIPESRWGKNLGSTNQFLKLLKDFHHTSQFDVFYNSHKSLYELAEKRFNTHILSEIDLEWYAQFYGRQPNEDFRIILGMGFTGNFGIKLKESGKKDQVFSVLGCWDFDADGLPLYRSQSGYTETVVHEFNHSFVNETQEKFKTQLEEFGPQIYNWVAPDMRKQAYSNWMTALNEGLVRAAVIHYFQSSKKANKYQRNQQLFSETFLQKFYWVPDLVEALDRYESNRSQYPNLESFLPELLNVYKKTAKNPGALYEKNLSQVFGLTLNAPENAPQWIGFFPENQSVNVPLTTKKIVLRFDREMQDAKNIYFPFFPIKTPPLEKAEFTKDRRELHIYLKEDLEPNTMYGLALGTKFLSVENKEMASPYLYTFSTPKIKKQLRTIEKNKGEWRFQLDPKIDYQLTDREGRPKMRLSEYLKEKNIEHVQLIGDFNQWQVNKFLALTRNSDGIYSVSVSQSQFTNQPLYTFLIDGTYYVLPTPLDSNGIATPNYQYFRIP